MEGKERQSGRNSSVYMKVKIHLTSLLPKRQISKEDCRLDPFSRPLLKKIKINDLPSRFGNSL